MFFVSAKMKRRDKRSRERICGKRDVKKSLMRDARQSSDAMEISERLAILIGAKMIL